MTDLRLPCECGPESAEGTARICERAAAYREDYRRLAAAVPIVLEACEEIERVGLYHPAAADVQRALAKIRDALACSQEHNAPK